MFSTAFCCNCDCRATVPKATLGTVKIFAVYYSVPRELKTSLWHCFLKNLKKQVLCMGFQMDTLKACLKRNIFYYIFICQCTHYKLADRIQDQFQDCTNAHHSHLEWHQSIGKFLLVCKFLCLHDIGIFLSKKSEIKRKKDILNCSILTCPIFAWIYSFRKSMSCS